MCPCIVGDGKIVLEDEHNAMASKNGLSSKENGVPSKRQRTTTHPVDLELEVVLGKMPRKVFGVFSLWKTLDDLLKLSYISWKLTWTLLQELGKCSHTHTYICSECFSFLQVFKLERIESKLEPLCIQSDLTVKEMLERVLRLPAVASKRYLTNKVY